jgi:predicted ester cyclase
MEMKIEAAWLRDFAKRYTGAWCSQNAARVAAFFALNGSLSVNGALAAGRSAITEVAQGFMTAFPDMELLMDSVAIEGDGAIYRWTFLGTNTGPSGTGHRVRFSGYEEWKFGENGLILESQGHFDAADYQRQLERGAD